MSAFDVGAVTVVGGPAAAAAAAAAAQLQQQDPRQASAASQRVMFREFFRTFSRGNAFPYRDALRTNYFARRYHVEVQFEDLVRYNADLAGLLMDRPGDLMPLFEEAAGDALQMTLTGTTAAAAAAAAAAATAGAGAAGTGVTDGTDPAAASAAAAAGGGAAFGGGSDIPAFQVLLQTQARTSSIRGMNSDRVSKLVHIPGIVISASRVRAKASRITIRCRSCHATKVVMCRPGFGGVQFPRQCDTNPAATGGERCPLDPYVIVPDSTTFVDQQQLKLQEMPEDVPTGEVPRHLLVIADRALVGRTPPGTRVVITGTHSIMQTQPSAGGMPSVRQGYLRALGIRVIEGDGGRTDHEFSHEEETEMRELASRADIVSRIANSISPAIFGHQDIKRAIACLLFGGSAKRLPDGARLRGDINVLLLGDPGVAKSQFLKFVEKVAPVGVYTSGKGSSAAGLTASVLRDPSTREFVIEGGAMVLADGGVVCIDEFDKMRPEDRVAIHEAMEQQTISIAKAGITTVLNSRCSVLAAANPVFGRYDDERLLSENVDFQSTILSRFDMIFLIRDVVDVRRDEDMARFVVDTQTNAAQAQQPAADIDAVTLKRFINYARKNCAPRLSEEAAQRLADHYADIRKQASSSEGGIPITVRQLEALARISESLAKMSLLPQATPQHVDDALELFRVSTMQAAATGLVADMLTTEMREEMKRCENALLQAVYVHANVGTRQLITQMTTRDNFSENVVRRTIDALVGKGDFRYQNQKQMLQRAK